MNFTAFVIGICSVLNYVLDVSMIRTWTSNVAIAMVPFVFILTLLGSQPKGNFISI